MQGPRSPRTSSFGYGWTGTAPGAGARNFQPVVEVPGPPAQSPEGFLKMIVHLFRTVHTNGAWPWIFCP